MMRMIERDNMKSRLVLLLIAVIAIGPACGQGEEPEDAAPTTVGATVQLGEYAVTATPSAVSAGSVQFTARNVGTIAHEFVVIRTELAEDQLPASEGTVDETAEGIEIIGEIEEFDAGGEQTASFELTAGNYVLICNVPGHYQLGMHTRFRVS